jgi:hypothetical protein
MKNIFIFHIVALLFFSCSKPQKKFSDDYVLIEFAAKLEGQYHSPKNKHHQETERHDNQTPYSFELEETESSGR